jgi:DNA-binding CsgD family transcriptional regulator
MTKIEQRDKKITELFAEGRNDMYIYELLSNEFFLSISTVKYKLTGAIRRKAGAKVRTEKNV